MKSFQTADLQQDSLPHTKGNTPVLWRLETAHIMSSTWMYVNAYRYHKKPINNRKRPSHKDGLFCYKNNTVAHKRPPHLLFPFNIVHRPSSIVHEISITSPPVRLFQKSFVELHVFFVNLRVIYKYLLHKGPRRRHEEPRSQYEEIIIF
jgi:hypothetical protein